MMVLVVVIALVFVHSVSCRCHGPRMAILFVSLLSAVAHHHFLESKIAKKKLRVSK